jgi:glyoxylase-like metal-dependent hydrolase (beta-lactamase superfamily II)
VRRIGRQLIALVPALWACASGSDPLEVETFRASEVSARLNAHLLLGAREALLVDATMTIADADEVAQLIDRSGRRLRTIFVTNSQPDKYLGLARLLARFPDARAVSTPEVAAEIAERGPAYLERLRARWGDRIASTLVVPEALDADELEIEGRAVRVLRFTGGECPNAAALYVPSLEALFPGAIVFEGSHLFLRERDIPGWRRNLERIRSHGGIQRIHPGHGAATDLRVLDAMHRYLDDFEAAVALGDPEAAIDAMTRRYPGYALERLLREYSVPAYLPRRD